MTAGYRPSAFDPPSDEFWWDTAAPDGPDCMYPRCGKPRVIHKKTGQYHNRYCQGHKKQKDRHGAAGMKPLRGKHGKKPVSVDDRPCKRCKREKCKECDHKDFTLVNTQRKLVSGEIKRGLGRRCSCCRRKNARRPEVRAYYREYHAKQRETGDHVERLRIERAAWRKKNRDRINARHRERMATDPEYAARCKETRRRANERRVKRMREDPEFRAGENAIRRMKDEERRNG